jgi:hypothetical protein
LSKKLSLGRHRTVSDDRVPAAVAILVLREILVVSLEIHARDQVRHEAMLDQQIAAPWFASIICRSHDAVIDVFGEST